VDTDDLTFIKWMETREALEMLEWPHENALLALIARRAYKYHAQSKHGLTFGQALIGKDDALNHCGLTPKRYRTAKRRLAKWGLVRFETTNKGTVATLLNNAVWNIDRQARGRPGASQGQAEGRPGASQGQAEGRPGAPKREQREDSADRIEEQRALEQAFDRLLAEFPSLGGADFRGAYGLWLAYLSGRKRSPQPEAIRLDLEDAAMVGARAATRMLREAVKQNWLRWYFPAGQAAEDEAGSLEDRVLQRLTRARVR